MTTPNGACELDIPAQDMSMKECLARMIRRITDDPELRADLLQEAVVHLWRSQNQRPGQTRSWYLQSCRFRIQHYLAAGRSVDSTKRRIGGLQLDSDSEDGLKILDREDPGESVLESVSARDILALLAPRLHSLERQVLECFADGLGAREIGRKLNMSHTMVIKHRRRIASLLQRLDAPPLPMTSISRLNGASKINGSTRQNGFKKEAA
jgi:RNA polymerase sigma factor (sigma-70 family)